MAEEELPASRKGPALKPAWRMRAVFEQKVVAPYRDTYRGDLGPAQVAALEELYQAGELRQQELSSALKISRQHVSKIVERLEERGFAKQVPDDEDSRCRKVCLTDAGRAYVEAHIEEGSERVKASDVMQQGPDSRPGCGAPCLDVMPSRQGKHLLRPCTRI